MKDISKSGKVQNFKLPHPVENLGRPLDLYNLGVSEFNEGNYLAAKKFFEKAKKAGLITSDVKTALANTNSKLELVESVEGAPYNYLTLIKSVPSDTIYASGLLIILFFITIKFFKKNNIIALPSLLGLALILVNFLILDNYQVGLSKEDSAVYIGPSRIFEQRQILPKGEKIIYKLGDKGWINVIEPQDYSGWLYKGKVIKI